LTVRLATACFAGSTRESDFVFVPAQIPIVTFASSRTALSIGFSVLSCFSPAWRK